VEQDELERPVGAAFGGSVLAETRPGHLADKVEEPRGLGRDGAVCGGSGHTRISWRGNRGLESVVYSRTEEEERKKSAPAEFA